MTTQKTDKKVETLDDLDKSAMTLAKQDANLTSEIESLTASRAKLRKERRAIEGRITTININEKTKRHHMED